MNHAPYRTRASQRDYLMLIAAALILFVAIGQLSLKALRNAAGESAVECISLNQSLYE